MKRILLRARKGPFDVVSPETTLERNLIGTNSGNLVFLHAAHKLLSRPDTEITTYGRRPDPADADWINERHDVYVIPLANAFRANFEAHLNRLTQLIERLRIPVVVLGVGAQSSLDYETDSLKPIEASVRAFTRAVLDRSPTIGVRGEFTESYLRSLGFRDVEVIGCPSMYFHGERLEVVKCVPEIDADTPLAINLSPGVPGLADLTAAHLERYRNLVYVAQDLDTLAVLLWQRSTLGPRGGGDLPLAPSHPLFRQDRVRFFIDPWPWISYLRTVRFAFGTRIHGNITALLAGTPAYVLAHDSRTLELARYFDIPHRRVDEGIEGIDAAQLYREADFAPLMAGHRRRFETFAAFLKSHGLEHAYADGNAPREFDARLEATLYPPPITVATAPPTAAATWTRRLRYGARRVSRSDWARRFSAAAQRLRSGASQSA